MSMPKQRKPYFMRTAVALGWLCLVVVAIAVYRPQFWRPAADLYQSALEDVRAGNNKEALDNMREALAADPDNLGFLIFTGNLELDQGRSDLAVDTFGRAVARESKSVEARLGLAKALAMQGESRRAVNQLDKLATMDLNRAQRRRTAGIYALAGDRRAALEQVKKLLANEKNPDRDLLRQALQLAAANNEWDYLLSLHTEPIVAAGDEEAVVEVANQRAMALRALGKYEQAYQLLKANLTEGNLPARAELALQLEHYDEAAKLLDQLQQKQPSVVRWARLRAYAMQKSGRARQAEEQFEKLYQAGQADRETLVRYVWLLNQQGKYGRAWQVLKTLKGANDDPALLELRARTAYWAGDMEAAAVLISQLLAQRQQR